MQALQYAALPWRRDDGLQILLITSRQTRRWVIPKGWPIAGLPPHQSAAREAFEEAGIAGETASPAIGHYHYLKQFKDGEPRLVRVEVFAMKVLQQHAAWPEQAERSARWFAAAEAATLVLESALAEVIRQFAAGVETT